MKRLLLVAILLFPIITLVLWVCWGTTRPGNAATKSATTTNLNVLPASH